ncbi:hypothetical protein XBKQ1_800003 [Xenorhabdus bovienii str. kraussei Quebec]|uniref:Uncharacterized protein n=1 Tax=Xenorhabdus bovienii str. kraussei Quebec TaxID=1398203 RepID=A0A077PQ12_XENBV|nr:hypothetical protein [Xenorhabdus bovienii]CDH21924.1 hypothetical protein XBKQ1_800003 [Xenorhabdus bovienii str. kraussei Quebec]
MASKYSFQQLLHFIFLRINCTLPPTEHNREALKRMDEAVRIAMEE